MFPLPSGRTDLLQPIRYIPRRNIQCTRCNQVLPITEFPPEYILRNKPNPLCRTCKKERHKALAKRFEQERKNRTDLPKEKECRGCHQIKPLTNYNISLNYKDGLHSHCKDCARNKSQELKKRWKKQRKNKKPPKEKLCTYCYQIYPIAHFCKNSCTKDGYDNICKDCLKKQHKKYTTKWKQQRTTTPPPKEKTCPGCQKTLPASNFYADETNKDGLNNYCIQCHIRLRDKYMKKWKKTRKKQTKKPQTKQCNICHQTLPLKNFYPNKRYKDGHSGTCIQCEQQRAQDYITQWKQETPTIPKEKQCQACKQILPADHFRKNKRKKDGLDYLCKKCSNHLRKQYNKKWEQQRKQKGKQEFSLYPTFEKTCTICKEIKPLSMFYRIKNSKDGYCPSCKTCNQKREKRYHEKIKKQPKITPKTKICSSCKQQLPATAFNKCNQRKDGLNIYCRDCQNKKIKEYRNRPEVKQRMKEWIREYNKKPEVREKTRKRARKYYNQPHVKAKAAAYRKKHRAKPEVKRRRQQYDREYYQRKKRNKINTS